jgi:hypothetical protein
LETYDKRVVVHGARETKLLGQAKDVGIGDIDTIYGSEAIVSAIMSRSLD